MREISEQISRRSALRRAVCLGAPALLRGRFPLFAQAKTQYSARAIRLLAETTVVDLLNQFRFADAADKPPKADLWLNRPGTFTAADAAVYQGSGIHVFSLGHSAPDYQEGLRFYARWNSFLAGYSNWLTRIDHASDFARVRREKKVGIMLTMQDSLHFRTPADVDEFFAMGQRLSQLTYNFNNKIGSGFLERRDGGLSVFGHSIMSRMEKVGMAVDLSACVRRKN